jgi:hypothetical protein
MQGLEEGRGRGQGSENEHEESGANLHAALLRDVHCHGVNLPLSALHQEQEQSGQSDERVIAGELGHRESLDQPAASPGHQSILAVQETFADF